MKLNVDKFTLTLAALQTATFAAVGFKAAKADGHITSDETADILTGSLEQASQAVGLTSMVVYDGTESATNSTAGRIAEGLIAAGTSIQHALKDRTVTFGECVTAIRAGVCAAFTRA